MCRPGSKGREKGKGQTVKKEKKKGCLPSFHFRSGKDDEGRDWDILRLGSPSASAGKEESLREGGGGEKGKVSLSKKKGEEGVIFKGGERIELPPSQGGRKKGGAVNGESSPFLPGGPRRKKRQRPDGGRRRNVRNILTSLAAKREK